MVHLVFAMTFDKNEMVPLGRSPERSVGASEGSLRWSRDSSVAAKALPQSDTNWTLQKTWYGLYIRWSENGKSYKIQHMLTVQNGA